MQKNYLLNQIINNKQLVRILYSISLILILIVFSKIILNFLNHGSDFDIPYKLSKIFLKKEDVFKNILDNPLYPHSLYILFSPFTLFELNTAKIIFLILNFFLLLLTIKNLSKIFVLNKQQTYIIFFIAFTATPFSNLLAIGNLSLIVFASLIYYYKTDSKILKAIFLTIAFFKYNISFIFLIHALCKKQFSVLIYFGLINIIFILIYYFYIDINLLKNFLDPFILAFELIQGKGSFEGYTNNISKTFFSIQSVLIFLDLDYFYIYIFFIILFIVSYLIFKSYFSYNSELVILFLTSSLLVYHGMYDYVILLPLVAYFLKYYQSGFYTFFYLLSVFFIFYFFKINKVLLNNRISDDIMSIIGCLLLILVFILILKNNKTENT